MWITPKRGLSINDVHAPTGIPVDVADDKLARELVAFGVAQFSSAPVKAPAAVIETAEAAPAVETAEAPHAKSRRRK